MTEANRPLKVFLSHAHSDKDVVQDLYFRLKKDGVNAWLDKEDIVGGQNFEIEIRKAVRESDVVIVCLSKEFNQAGFRQREVKWALDAAMNQPEGEIFIIPLRLEECETLESLRKLHWVDHFEDDGYERLMHALQARAISVGATLQVKKGWLSKVPPRSRSAISPKDTNNKPSQENKPPENKKPKSAETQKRSKKTFPIVNFKWNLTLFSILLIATVFIVYSQKIVDATDGSGFLVVIPFAIVISFFQWFLLRKNFARAVRWIWINTVYVLTISLIAISFFIGASFTLDEQLPMQISFFVILSLWFIPNYYTGYLVFKQNKIINTFFSMQGAWNISFWIKWISTPVLGFVGTIVFFLLLYNPLNSFFSSDSVSMPSWFVGALIPGVWGGLIGLFQWLILRNSFKNFRWLIIVYVVLGGIPWGDISNIFAGIMNVLWILFSLILAPILVWKQETQGKSESNRIHLKQRHSRRVIGVIVILLVIGLSIKFSMSSTSDNNGNLFTATMTPYTGSLGMDWIDPKGVEMRLVPAGEFTMGSTSDEGLAKCKEYRTDCVLGWYIDEEYPHTVYLDSYYIDKYEVTNASYKVCVDVGTCKPPEKTSSETRPRYYGNPQFNDYPVVYVSWFMAKTYCEWRGARLPTEAEWEKAARGDDERMLPWGGDLDCEHANFWQSNAGACKGDSSPVSSYEKGKSPYGVYNMVGNVWEWVSSLYMPYPYDAIDGRENISSPGTRVARGDSWFNFDVYIRITDRLDLDPSYTSGDIGIRCALTP